MALITGTITETVRRIKEQLAAAQKPSPPPPKPLDWGGSAGVGLSPEPFRSPAASLMSEAPVRAYEAEVLRTHTRQSEDVIPKFRQINESVAQYTRPVMQPVRNAVGDVIRASAPVVEQLPVIGQVQQVGKVVPRFPTPTGVGAGAAEAMVPVEPWEIALELVPGIGTVPGVTSFGKTAIRKMLAEEGLPATRAGVQALIKKRTAGGIKTALEMAADESGMAKIPGKAAGDLPEPKPGAEGAAGGMPASAADNLPPPPTPAVAPNDKIGTVLQQRLVASVKPGMYVKAADRANFGKVVDVQPETATATVFFRNKKDGVSATVHLPLSQLTPSGVKRTTAGVAWANMPPAEQVRAWELMNPEDRDLINGLAEIVPAMEDRASTLKAGRAAQFGRANAAYDQAISEGRTVKEAMAAERKAMAGEILHGEQLPEALTSPERVDYYYTRVRQSLDEGTITKGEYIAAKNGLDLLTEGARSNGDAHLIMGHEVKSLARVFGPAIESVLPATPAKMLLFAKIMAPAQLYRSMKTALDNSFGGGQGWKMLFSDRRSWWGGEKASWKAIITDEKGGEALLEQMRKNSPYYVRAQEAERPLGIMTLGGGAHPAEEFMSPITKHVPGMSRSERGFVVGGSVMRQNALDRKAALWKAANGGKEVPDDVFQRMIDMVNEASGWGNVQALGDWHAPLSQGLFSIRAKAALFQYPATIAKAVAPGADPTLRKMAAADFAAWIAGNGVIMGMSSGMAALAAYVGYNVPGGAGAQTNPLSKDFGKIKFGPQRIDIWQGYSPLVKLIIQSAAATKKGDWKRPGELGKNYTRNQLSPGFTIPSDYFLGGGKSITGDSMAGKDYWLNAVSPMFIADAAESLAALGVLGVPGALLSFKGVRVSTYEDSTTTKKRTPLQRRPVMRPGLKR